MQMSIQRLNGINTFYRKNINSNDAISNTIISAIRRKDLIFFKEILVVK